MGGCNFRREQLFVHLCICAFVLPMRQQNHRKKTNTQKTPSDGNCSTMLICVFVYLCIHQHNHSLTIPIPKENSVGTFRYQKGGSAPLFPQKGGNGPLFEKLNPLLEKKGGGKGGSIQKRGERYRPKYRKSSKSDTGKIPIPKKLPVPPRYLLVGQGRYRDLLSSYLKILITPPIGPPWSILTSPSCSPPPN